MKLKHKILIGNVIAFICLVEVVHFIILGFLVDHRFGFFSCGFMFLLCIMAKTMNRLYDKKDEVEND